MWFLSILFEPGILHIGASKKLKRRLFDFKLLYMDDILSLHNYKSIMLIVSFLLILK